jgi:hypothetical protein
LYSQELPARLDFCMFLNHNFATKRAAHSERRNGAP